MTTTVTISDSEKIALKAALEMMIEHCEDQIVAGEGAPYWSYRHSCNKVLIRLDMIHHATTIARIRHWYKFR
jgi:hypothetical protein